MMTCTRCEYKHIYNDLSPVRRRVFNLFAVPLAHLAAMRVRVCMLEKKRVGVSRREVLQRARESARRERERVREKAKVKVRRSTFSLHMSMCIYQYVSLFVVLRENQAGET
jgi:hypothetical protein